MRVLILTLLISLVPTAYASEKQLPEVMQHLADSLLTLMPIVSSKDFDGARFTQEVTRLQAYVHEAEDHFDNQSDSARITYTMLRERVDEVAVLSADNSVLTAKSVLSDSLELCASCHTQDRRSRPGFGVSRLHDLDEFQAAEFSFLSRDYTSALTSYQNFLAQDSADDFRRSLALDRILEVTTEVYGDLAAATQMLGEIKLTTEAERIRVANWQSVFNKLRESDSLMSPLKPQTIAEMDHFLTNDWPTLQSFMNWNEQQAYWMLIRRKLNTLMEAKHDKQSTPVLLYWQAVADRSTHFQFYESLSRRYLERCIRQYPQHAYAQKCFDEFELLMIVSFSGSGGINMPIEVRNEINELRRIVYAPDQ